MYENFVQTFCCNFENIFERQQEKFLDNFLDGRGLEKVLFQFFAKLSPYSW